jgi:hypothetical protein
MDMLKSILLLMGLILLSSTVSIAQTIKADYDVSYGIFGQIGTANALLTKDKKKYSIDIHLEATGLAKVLSGDRKERHISKGHLERGLMVSDLYQVIKSHGDTVINKEYWTDHKRKRVIKKHKKFKEGKLVSEKNTILDFYAKDDLLTLYFNLDSAIKEKHKPKRYLFQAVGAEKQKGKVTVIIPKKHDLPKYVESLGNDAAWYATAIIHQQIFSSHEGRLLLGVGEDGITNQAVLKDVIFFGDIKGIRVK